MKHKPSYSDFFSKNVNKSECLFFLKWLTEATVEILKVELNVQRKGLPKAGPRPMVRNKQFLALANTLTNFKLKEFADHFGVSYGVVRLWNREEDVRKRASLD